MDSNLPGPTLMPQLNLVTAIFGHHANSFEENDATKLLFLQPRDKSWFTQADVEAPRSRRNEVLDTQFIQISRLSARAHANRI